MESRVLIHHLVIEEFDKLNDKHITELMLDEYLRNNQSIRFYVFIKHDSDVNADGEKIREHYHLVVVMKNPIIRMTLIKDIAKELFINVNCISSQYVRNLVSSVQYLLHKNEKDKFHYELLDLWTNDLDECIQIIECGHTNYELEIDYLIKLVSENKSYIKIYSILGLKAVKQYRGIIRDLHYDEWGF